MGDGVERWTADELAEAQGTPGIRRWVASEGEGHWFGRVAAEAETMSAWHHHGDNETLGYVVSGRIRFEFGPGGGEQLEVGAGEFFRVPAGAIHREGNQAGDDAEVVLVRIGEGPPVFPADGPEPAEP